MAESLDRIPNRAPTTKRRNLQLAVLAGVVALAAAGSAGYWKFYASRYVSTDNAYAAVEIAQITPAVAGTIAEVGVKDTESAKKGDILVIIDPTDAKLALAQADAEDARVAALLMSAEADLRRTKLDLDRRQALVSSGSVSTEELTRAQNAYASAEANVRALKASGIQARARREQAAVDLDRTIIRSPVAGIVARRLAEVGQRVQAGALLMSVVPVQEMHVDANFKEGELEKVRPGQSATLKADIYGDTVVYHGVVDGFSGGTGAAFAAIPAQNATGNWIKVVQRVPVRIHLDAAELRAHPLRVGLSMNVTIDTRDESGRP